MLNPLETVRVMKNDVQLPEGYILQEADAIKINLDADETILINVETSREDWEPVSEVTAGQLIELLNSTEDVPCN